MLKTEIALTQVARLINYMFHDMFILCICSSQVSLEFYLGKSVEETSMFHNPGEWHPSKFMLPGFFFLPYTYNP